MLHVIFMGGMNVFVLFMQRLGDRFGRSKDGLILGECG